MRHDNDVAGREIWSFVEEIQRNCTNLSQINEFNGKYSLPVVRLTHKHNESLSENESLEIMDTKIYDE